MRAISVTVFTSEWPVPWRRESYADGSASTFIGIYKLGVKFSIGEKK